MPLEINNANWSTGEEEEEKNREIARIDVGNAENIWKKKRVFDSHPSAPLPPAALLLAFVRKTQWSECLFPIQDQSSISMHGPYMIYHPSSCRAIQFTHIATTFEVLAVRLDPVQTQRMEERGQALCTDPRSAFSTAPRKEGAAVPPASYS
jgi:hypothetical protein